MKQSKFRNVVILFYCLSCLLSFSQEVQPLMTVSQIKELIKNSGRKLNEIEGIWLVHEYTTMKFETDPPNKITDGDYQVLIVRQYDNNVISKDYHYIWFKIFDYVVGEKEKDIEIYNTASDNVYLFKFLYHLVGKCEEISKAFTIISNQFSLDFYYECNTGMGPGFDYSMHSKMNLQKLFPE